MVRARLYFWTASAGWQPAKRVAVPTGLRPPLSPETTSDGRASRCEAGPDWKRLVGSTFQLQVQATQSVTLLLPVTLSLGGLSGLDLQKSWRLGSVLRAPTRAEASAWRAVTEPRWYSVAWCSKKLVFMSKACFFINARLQRGTSG